MQFLGDYPAKVDAKGRVFLPAAFRKTLMMENEPVLVLRQDVFQHCLTIYPKSVWDATVNGLKAGLNQWNSKQQMMLRKFLMDAEPIELDSQGRLLISKRKLQYAGIESDVRFLAMMDKIEIWSKQTLEALSDEQDTLGDDIEATMGT